MNYISGHGEYALFFRMEGVFNGLSLTGIGNSRVHQVIPTLLQQTGPTKLTVIESGPDTRTALIPSPVFFFQRGFDNERRSAATSICNAPTSG